MTMKRLVAGFTAVVLLTILWTGALTPSAASALNTGETVAVVVGGVVAYGALISVGTWYLVTQNRGAMALQADPRRFDRRERDQPVRYGPQCPLSSSGQLPMVCW